MLNSLLGRRVVSAHRTFSVARMVRLITWSRICGESFGFPATQRAILVKESRRTMRVVVAAPQFHCDSNLFESEHSKVRSISLLPSNFQNILRKVLMMDTEFLVAREGSVAGPTSSQDSS